MLCIVHDQSECCVRLGKVVVDLVGDHIIPDGLGGPDLKFADVTAF